MYRHYITTFIYLFQTKSILEIHKSRCPNYNSTVQVSLDGVAECRSNTNSLDVYSLRFLQCRCIYPVQIIRPIGKFRVDPQESLDDFLSDVCSNDCRIHSFVGDNQKRCTARAAKGHCAYFPCEYCFSKGQLLNHLDSNLQEKKKQLLKQKESVLTKISNATDNNDENEIQTLNSVLSSINDAIKAINTKHNKIVWPASSRNGEQRTIEKVLDITSKIENNETLSLDEAKGIVGRSLFLDIPYFIFLEDIPTEYLHSVCLGCVKRLIELTFNVGESRQRNTTRKLSLASDFNKLMSKVLVFRECSRRARALDFSVMKGQEFRNIVLFFFPLVIECIQENAKERRVWLLLSYMIRMCVIPNIEYELIDQEVLSYCSEHFYELYEQLFGVKNCTYNTHIVGSHLKNMRIHGPLTFTSAFGFESFYGEMRQSFTPGTLSPLKQILEKTLLKRTISPHSCKLSIYYSPKETAMESNCYIYTFVNQQYSFYKIVSIEENIMECLKVGKSEITFPETPNLNWSVIGVFKAGEISDEIVSVHKKVIAGKFIRVLNLFITCPINVLEEK